MLQAGVKTFYLRKTGRSKHVEAATVTLCRAVLDQWFAHAKVALFAVMCDIQPAAAMGDRIPKFVRGVRRKGSAWEICSKKLEELPLDGAFAMSSFMKEIKTLRRASKQAADDHFRPGRQQDDEDE